ncbi:MAG: CDP-alcohol phosphatidyltransferase family protein [Actinomycetota bacterium]|nr:CDP-alcohol phosphatidyltransferase family protein [Actinomycetota bacterium]
MSRPSVAEVRAVAQPPAVLGRRNAEHWSGELYLRRISPYVTRELVSTPITPNGVTGLMIASGAGAGGALLVPGLPGGGLAALLAQLQMLWDCSDGELARWRGTSSPAGVFLDKLGHYTAEGLIPLALGVRADGGLRSIGGWTTMGSLLGLLVLYNKALNDMVRVSRAQAGLPALVDDASEVRPRARGARRLRALARFVPFHRAYHSIELTLLALGAAVADELLGDAYDGLGGTRALVAVLVPAALVTVVGHTTAILTSSRLR